MKGEGFIIIIQLRQRLYEPSSLLVSLYYGSQIIINTSYSNNRGILGLNDCHFSIRMVSLDQEDNNSIREAVRKKTAYFKDMS